MPRMLARAGIVVALLATPALVLAASDTVTLTTDTVLSVNGITMNVTGSSATVESITISGTTFSFVLQSGSVIQVTAPDNNKMVADTTSDQTTNTCTSSLSLLKYTGTAERTVTVTPSGTACGSSGGSASGGGGGGGSSSATPATPVTPAVPATTVDSGCAPGNLFSTTTGKACVVTVDSGCAPGNLFSTTTGKACVVGAMSAVPATPSTNSSGSNAFNVNLTIGSTGADVKALQVFLNTHGYAVASSGPGSAGNETTMFGSLTKAALAKYQQAKGIKPAVGYFGPLTRASVNAEQ